MSKQLKCFRIGSGCIWLLSQQHARFYGLSIVLTVAGVVLAFC